MKPTLILHARELRKHAKKIADGIARANPGGCCVIARPAPNPTLIAHGLVKASRWHIVTHDPPRRAVADLYAGSHAEAARVTRLLANMISSNGGRPVTLDLLDNRATPAQLRAHPKSSIASNPDDRTHLQGLNTREQALYAERGLRGVGIGTCGVEKRGKRWHVLIDRGAPLGPKLRSRINPSRSKSARARRESVHLRTSRKERRSRSHVQAIHHIERARVRAAAWRKKGRRRANPKGRFSVRRIDDLVKSSHGDYTQSIFEVVDSSTGKVVMRSYNQRDARTEAAYRNKHDARGAFARPKSADHPSAVGHYYFDDAGQHHGPFRTIREREQHKRSRRANPRGRIPHQYHGGFKDKDGYVVLTAEQWNSIPAVYKSAGKKDDYFTTGLSVAARGGRLGLTWLPVRISGAIVRSGHRLKASTRTRAKKKPKAIEVPIEAFEDWMSGRAYVDNAGNYRLRASGKTSGRVAPWNRAAKRAFASVTEFARTARATIGPQANARGGPNARTSGLRRRHAAGRSDHRTTRRGRAVGAAGRRGTRVVAAHAKVATANPKGRIGTRQKARRVAVGAARGRRSRRVPNRLPSTRPRKYLGWSIERHRFTDAGVETFARFAYGPNGERVIESSGHEPTAEAAIRKHVRDIVEGSREAPALTLTRMSPRGNPRGRFNARRNSRKKGGRSAATAARRRPRARASHSAATRHPNPASRDSAAKLVRMFEDRGPIKVKHTRTRSPKPMSGAVAKIGDVVAVTYRSKKFDGKSKDYEHEFKSPKPLLVADPSSGDLNLVRGKSRYGLTPDGIIN